MCGRPYVLSQWHSHKWQHVGGQERDGPAWWPLSAMARWLEQQIRVITQEFLGMQARLDVSVIDLLGSVRGDYPRQGREDKGFAAADFAIDWEAQLYGWTTAVYQYSPTRAVRGAPAAAQASGRIERPARETRLRTSGACSSAHTASYYALPSLWSASSTCSMNRRIRS